jgi:putative CocE/NonD family hydrolase
MSNDQKPLSTKPIRFMSRLELRGTQLAGWAPRMTNKPLAGGILFDENVEIVLPDGTILKADLFRPAGSGRVPVLVSWAVYIKDTERMGAIFIDESGICDYVINQGYAELRVQPRGTGSSGGLAGDEMFGAQEVQDCHDAIEWAAKQQWCNGDVGMIGMSAFAVAQLMVAAKKPPHLKAIFPYKGFTDIYRHGFYKGGTPYTGAMELFALAEKTVPPKIPAWARHLASHVLNHKRFARYMSDAAGTVISIRKMLKKIKPPEAAVRGYVRRMFDNAFDDGGYYRGSSPAAVIGDIEVPVCVGTDFGAQGFHFFGAFELWHRLKGPKKMFIGPPEYEFPWSNYLQECVAWYDWTLKGLDNGYAELPPIRYWLRGAEIWEQAQDWPLPEAKDLRLYLQRGDESDLRVQKLSPDAPSQPGSHSLIAIPSGGYYVAELDKYETQILRFQTPTYDKETSIIGPVKMRLMLSASAIDTYVVARLSDIAPDGKRTKLAWGWLLASHRTVDEARSNPTEIVHDHRACAAKQLTPGEPAELLFSLTPIANMFRPGHAMELEIAARPELLLSEKGEGFDMFSWEAVPYRCRNTIHTGADTGSYLEVMVKPALL